MGIGNYIIDMTIINAFLKNIMLYKNGSFVKLSTGEIGIIVDLGKAYSSRPIVHVLFDKSGDRHNGKFNVDLSQEPTTFITEIITA